jgi:sugar transferase (PEP-CTERM/EpsH1 system associated)
MKKKIHIQHVLLSLQPGGLENGVVNVVNRLSSDRFRSSICCLKQAGEFLPRVNPSILVHEMGWRGGNDPWLPFRLARLFRETRPDVVHTRNAESFYYGFLGAKLAGVKSIVHSEHGRTFNDRAIRFSVQRWFSAYTQALFAVSGQLKQDLVKHIGIPEQHIRVLHNGVDLEHFGSNDRAAVRHQLGLREIDLVIGSVGRLVPVKNYSLLLTAIAALDKKNLVAVLVGDGPARAGLEDMATSLGIDHQVRFLGHRNDVMSLLSAMDIFVLPSTYEGMSNTLLEAMASGVASVASDVGGNSEIISHGRDGYLFSNGDALALTGFLQELSCDAGLRRRLGEMGRVRIARKFSIEAMIACYENIYQTSIANYGQ